LERDIAEKVGAVSGFADPLLWNFEQREAMIVRVLRSPYRSVVIDCFYRGFKPKWLLRSRDEATLQAKASGIQQIGESRLDDFP
jgi:hypothetical protein